MNNKLSPRAAGLALGIYRAFGLFCFGILARLTGYCKIFVSFLSTFYIGYTYTFVGALIGILWGFVDGFIGAYIVIWLYNIFTKPAKK